MVELINREEKILPYIDMPLQHINDRILKLMNRNTPKKRINAILDKLRSGIDNLTLRTTFIVGFPGETDEEFEELLDFVNEARFDRAGAFKYSQEEGTPAGTMEDQIPEEITEERYERLMEVQSEVSLNKNKELIGTSHEGFIEGTEGGYYVARIASQAPEVDGFTYIEQIGDYKNSEAVNIRITKADIYDLYGEIIK